MDARTDARIKERIEEPVGVFHIFRKRRNGFAVFEPGQRALEGEHCLISVGSTGSCFRKEGTGFIGYGNRLPVKVLHALPVGGKTRINTFRERASLSHENAPPGFLRNGLRVPDIRGEGAVPPVQLQKCHIVIRTAAGTLCKIQVSALFLGADASQRIRVRKRFQGNEKAVGREILKGNIDGAPARVVGKLRRGIKGNKRLQKVVTVVGRFL